MMPVVMRLIGSPCGATEFDGQYLEDFDFEAHEGRGEALFTRDLAKAKRFDDLLSAMRFRDTVPDSRRWRSDGRLNRPMTATHWSIIDPDKGRNLQ